MRKGHDRSMREKGTKPLLSLRVRRGKEDSGFPPLMWVLIGLLLLSVVAIVRTMIRHDQQLTLEREINRTEVPRDMTEWDPNWPPLPPVNERPPRPLDQVRAAYAFAARKPDVLRYVPCYCGCEHHGHRSNLDCYVRGLNREGMPEWDTHAFT